MPTFHYVAKRGPQDVVEGVFEADHRNRVLEHLTGLGYVPVRVLERGAPVAAAPAMTPAASTQSRVRPGRIPRRSLQLMTRQLASLIRSQVPLLRALQIVQDQSEHPRVRALLLDLAENVRQGQALSEAMARHPAAFSPLMISLIHAGEVSGTLDTVFDRLTEQADREEAMRTKIQTALAYPLSVGVVGVLTVVVLVTFVLPRLLRLFTTMGDQLPLPTRLLMSVTQTMSQAWFWVVLLGMLAAGAVCIRQFRHQLRPYVDRWLLKLPVAGPLIHHLEFARFARAFAILLGHGVSILQATDVAIPVVRHTLMRRELTALPQGLRDGQSLAACLRPLSIATPFAVNTVAVGEEAGRLGEALAEIADFYERETERQLHVLSSLLEPAMMLVVGSIVGFIVMAVLLPIFYMSFTVR